MILIALAIASLSVLCKQSNSLMNSINLLCLVLLSKAEERAESVSTIRSVNKAVGDMILRIAQTTIHNIYITTCTVYIYITVKVKN